MNAKEAREKTEQNIRTEVDGQYMNIKKEIDEAVASKKFQIIHYGDIRKETREVLVSEGFKVLSQAGRPGDKNDTIISW